MKITKNTVEEVIKDMRLQGKNSEDIEQNFQDALKAGLINVDIYYMAMKTIYE